MKVSAATRVLAAVRRSAGSATQIAARTGLSRSSVSAALTRLHADGCVEVLEWDYSSGGRASPVFGPVGREGAA